MSGFEVLEYVKYHLCSHSLLLLQNPYPLTLECTHVQINDQKAYPKQREVTLYLVASQTERRETVTNMFSV